VAGEHANAYSEHLHKKQRTELKTREARAWNFRFIFSVLISNEGSGQFLFYHRGFGHPQNDEETLTRSPTGVRNTKSYTTAIEINQLFLPLLSSFYSL